MDIQILHGYKGCLAAQGVAVVIDVFRATTTICCLLQNQPQKILLLKEIKELAPYLNHPNFVCFSEIGTSEKKHDNSPLAALKMPLKDKIAVLVTTNGTVAVDLVRHCEHTLVAAFVNSDGIIDYLLEKNPPRVSLIAIGNLNRAEEALEDNLCAEMIHSRLLRQEIDERTLRKKLFQRINERSHVGFEVKNDLSICAAIGIFNSVPKIVYANDKMWVIDAIRC